MEFREGVRFRFLAFLAEREHQPQMAIALDRLVDRVQVQLFGDHQRREDAGEDRLAGKRENVQFVRQHLGCRENTGMI